MSKEATCDECGVEMNNTNEICEDCIYWGCDLIDENEDKISERNGIPSEAKYDQEVSKI